MKKPTRLEMYGKFALMIIVLAAVGCLLFGCAIGRADDGSIVGGIKLAQLPETAGEMMKAATNFLPPPWDLVVGAGTSLLFGGTSMAVLGNRARRREDLAYDDAQRNTLTMMATPPPLRTFAAPPNTLAAQWTGIGPDPSKV